MTRTTATLLYSTGLALSLLWAAGAGYAAWHGWDAVRGSIAIERDSGKAGCSGRYDDEPARQRCRDLFDVQYFATVNTALATRAVIVLGPAMALTLVVVLGRRAGRHTPSTRRPRK